MVRIPWIDKSELREEANEFLSEHARDIPPVEITWIAEFHFDLQVIPHSSKLAGTGLEAFLTSDLSSIYYKKSLSRRRRRYSIAHEMAHYILHQEYHKEFLSEEEWFEYREQIRHRDRAESQAYILAGLILVPDYELQERISGIFHNKKDKIPNGSSVNYDSELFWKYIADEVGEIFDVSSVCARKCLERDDYWCNPDNIPD